MLLGFTRIGSIGSRGVGSAAGAGSASITNSEFSLHKWMYSTKVIVFIIA
jgi:hypothetical protein